MFGIYIKVSKLDYSSISESAMPWLLEKLSEHESAGSLARILSRLKDLPGKSVAAALKILPENVKDEIAISLIKINEAKIIATMNNLLNEKRLPLTVGKIQAEKREDMEVNLLLNDFDYAELIMALYTTLMHAFSSRSEFARLFAVLDKRGHFERAINAAFAALSQDEKDELTASIIAAYEGDIISRLNALTMEKGVELTFSGIEIRSEDV